MLVRKFSYVRKVLNFFEEYFKGIAASYPLVNFWFNNRIILAKDKCVDLVLLSIRVTSKFHITQSTLREWGIKNLEGLEPS